MKKYGFLALVFVILLASCSPSFFGGSYEISDFPMRPNELWSVAFRIGANRMETGFSLKYTPFVDRDGDVVAELIVSSKLSKGLAYIDNADGTFVLRFVGNGLVWVCRAPMGSDWEVVGGEGYVSDGRNEVEGQCAFGRG